MENTDIYWKIKKVPKNIKVTNKILYSLKVLNNH